MPEIAEVETVRNTLKRRILHKKIKEVEVYYERMIENNINDFKNGLGMFSTLGNEVFEDYWRGFPKYRATTRDYTTLQEYLEKKNKGE